MDTSILRSRAPAMQSIHPDENLKNALIPVIIAWVLLWLSIDFGIFDKFLMVIQEFDLHGVMGLWGE